MNPGEYESQAQLSVLYDNLSRYSYFLNRLRGKYPLIMHKILKIPDEFSHLYLGKEKYHYLDDLVLREADLPENPRVLDAGCGFGGSIFRWHQRKPGIYHGFTLSKYQQKIALREAQRRGIEQNALFHIQSYSEPIYLKYHSVIAIESLIHSQDLAAVIRNLSQALLPQGKLVIVDDMTLNKSVHQTQEYKLLTNSWLISDLATGEYYSELLSQNGLKITCHLDLTPHLYFSSDQSLQKREKLLSILIRIMPIESIRSFLKTHLGGFALERLYQQGKIKYQMMIAVKQH